MSSYGPYRTVVVDPPWPVLKFGRRKARPKEAPTIPYRTMSIDDIKALEINRWASEDAYLFLWTTSRYLYTAFDVMDTWRFNYHATLTWCKSNGICPYSPFRMASEFVLFGTRDGKLFKQFPRGRLLTWFQTPAPTPGHHSEKPSQFYELVREVTPEPRIDLFARSRHVGFDAWGDEAPPSRCSHCLGTGSVPLAGATCSVCGGTGHLGRPDDPQPVLLTSGTILEQLLDLQTGMTADERSFL